MNKARYAKSRWWVAASAAGAFVAMFGALFAHDRDASGAVEAAALVAPPVTQPASTTNRGVRAPSTTQQSARQVQPTAPSTTTQPHTRTRAS